MTATSPNSSDDKREVRCPRCPRCGYDQRGPIHTWTDTCPLQGTCTECGLTFLWCEVLQPEKFEPQWCIEFEPKKRRLPRAALRTYARSWLPWRFWSRLKMSDAIRWRRLIIYVVLLLLPGLLVYVLAQGSLATYARVMIEGNLQQVAASRSQTIQSLQAAVRQQATALPTGDAWQDSQINALVASWNAEIARLQALGSATERIDSSWLVTTLEAIVTPLAQTSAASIVDPNGIARYPYIPPADLLLIFGQRGGWGGGTATSTLLMSLVWLSWGIVMTALLPLSFALMPFSMRKAKVRWAHVIRVTIYSLFVPVTCLWLTALLLGPAHFFDWDGLTAMYASLVRYVPWLALALWWHAATSQHLKIPHAWLTIASLTLMCLLILLGITAAIDPRLAWEMLDLFEPLIR